MSLNETPSAGRVHIGFFGKRNAGKSTLVNAVCNQELCIVSDTPGTTTDPVYKAMELLPLGPVVVIDTPGFDDVGELGEKRVAKTKQVLNKTDIAVVVINASIGRTKEDDELIDLIYSKDIPCIIAYNKLDEANRTDFRDTEINSIVVSAKGLFNIDALRDKIAEIARTDEKDINFVADFVENGDYVVLVIPIDEAAPKNRIILPQQMAIRDCLEVGAIPVCCRETELEHTLATLGNTPKLVITDSQAFAKVADIVPETIKLTSFSILMARYKGVLDSSLKGIQAIDSLKDGDRVLISEGCTHRRQCGDIGTVKLPALIKKHTGADIIIETTSGTEFKEDLSGYKVIIHCGGCMLNEREMNSRRKDAADQNIPFTNYGLAIAHMTGILKRSTEITEE